MIGESNTVQQGWLYHINRVCSESEEVEFDLLQMLENAAGQTHAEMAEAVRSARSDLGGKGDDICDITDICRYGLEMAPGDVMGSWESQWKVQVRAALATCVASSTAPKSSTSIQFEGEAYEVCNAFILRLIAALVP